MSLSLVRQCTSLDVQEMEVGVYFYPHPSRKTQGHTIPSPSYNPYCKKITHLFPFVVDFDVDMLRSSIEPLLDLIEQLGQFIMLRLMVLRDVQVIPPIVRIEPPMACSVLQVPVRVADELLWREHALALEAFYATFTPVRVELGRAQPGAFPETLVVHFEGDGALEGPRRGEDGRVEQGAAEALGVRFRYEPAGGGAVREDAVRFELVELLGGAAGAEDLEVVALLVDLVEGELAEDRIEHLGQAEALLAADDEAGDRLALEDGLGAFAARRVGRRQDRELERNARARTGPAAGPRRESLALLLHLRGVPLREGRPRPVEAFRRAVLIVLEHRLEVRRYQLHFGQCHGQRTLHITRVTHAHSLPHIRTVMTTPVHHNRSSQSRFRQGSSDPHL